MSGHRVGCVVCGEELKYSQTEKLRCYFCNELFEANVKCRLGHYVCDVCHSLPAEDLIASHCVASKSENPLEIALDLMRNPRVKMHGPEHHFLVPAVLLAAYYNTRKEYDKKNVKIEEARSRSSRILGGFCGFYGDCGAAVGTGIFMSLVTNSTPLSVQEWRLSNLMTARSLLVIANHGGPRCCKRNTFLAINEAVKFARENLGVEMKIEQGINCEFTDFNKECLQNKCPFNPKK